MTIPVSPDRGTGNVGITRMAEPSPSLAARLLSGAVRLTLHNALAVGSAALGWPLPFGAIERAARVLPAPHGIRRTPVRLPHARAQLLQARGVTARGGRVVLYCHGGAFLCGGISTHLRLIDKLSEFSDSPVLAVDYRMLPKYTIAMAMQDCHDSWRWLQAQGYEPEQIAIAGDSAGGYLALALAQRLQAEGETPAALALLSPLLQLTPNRPAADGPMLPHHSFAALTALIAAHDGVLYEPLEHIRPGLPPTLIHVSGAEELAYDARLAAEQLAAAEVPVELGIWPGQIHVFQLAAPLVPEATRSLRQIGAYLLDAMSCGEQPDSVA